MIQHRQDINGHRYQYDSGSGAVFYCEADADAFAYDHGVTYLSACGCRAETGCQCRLEITSLDRQTNTPVAEIRAGVERVRRDMAAERERREVRRRVRNEIARDFEYLRQNPNPDGYKEALARLRGPEPGEMDIYENGAVPDGYAEGLKKLGLPEPLPIIHDDSGVPLPYDTALQRR